MSFNPVPGMPVVCVRPWRLALGTGAGDERGPVKGMVYTIREAGYLHPCFPNEMAVRLVEIVNRAYNYQNTGLWELAFHIDRFKPLDEHRLDIFREMLTKARGPWARADA